jgi:D-inositol-3-phosphate glycosyltransferase
MSVYTREIAREMGRRGHYVDIYTRMTEPAGERIVELYDNVRLIHLNDLKSGPKDKLELYPMLPHFFNELDDFRSREHLRYDLIHSHYWLSGELGRLIQHHWGVPHVIRFHTLGAAKDLTGIGTMEPRIRIETENRLVNTCRRVLAATEEEKQQLIEHYDAAPEKIGVVSCGVDLDLFRPENKMEARRLLGFDKEESIVLYVGRFDPIKGIDRLLTALAYLNDRQRVRLVIIGGDGYETPESRHLKSLSVKLGVQDAVTFVGRVQQQQLPPYYRAADVLGMTSHYESFGLVGLEALACGTPVVATPVGAMEKIIRERETGSVVNDPSPASLAGAIERFINGRDDGVIPPRFIHSSVREYSWSHVTSSILDEYAVVLEREKINGARFPDGETSILSLTKGEV